MNIFAGFSYFGGDVYMVFVNFVRRLLTGSKKYIIIEVSVNE